MGKELANEDETAESIHHVRRKNQSEMPTSVPASLPAPDTAGLADTQGWRVLKCNPSESLRGGSLTFLSYLEVRIYRCIDTEREHHSNDCEVRSRAR